MFLYTHSHPVNLEWSGKRTGKSGFVGRVQVKHIISLHDMRVLPRTTLNLAYFSMENINDTSLRILKIHDIRTF